MKITVKCPNCGGQNEQGDLYCTVCGVRLKEDVPPAPTPPSPEPAPEKASSAKPMYCSRNPSEHIIKDPTLGFCSICGAPLTETPAAPVSSGAPSPSGAPRVCKNGHVCSDPLAVTCPECGLPFENGARRGAWKCESCGHINSEEDNFCTNCRQKRGEKRGPEPAPVRHANPIPEGMHPAGEDDLVKRS